MPKSPRRRRSGRRIFGLGLLIVAIVAGYQVYNTLGVFARGGGGMANVWSGIVNPRGKFPGQSRTTILIVGKDYSHTNKGIAYTKDSRADTVLLLGVDLENRKIGAVAIPRDTRVKAPDGVTGKINATFRRGGIELLRGTIQSMFDVRIDHTVVLKADAVREIVDAVGGVEIEPIDRMFYEDFWGGLKIDLQPGRQWANGEQAVGFVRFRKTGTHRVGPKGEAIPVDMPRSKEEGDLRRTERQQQLIRSLTASATRPQNFARAPQILETAFSQIETDLKRTQVLALATLFKTSGTSAMVGGSIPGRDGKVGDEYFWLPDIDRGKLTIQWLAMGDDAAGKKLTRVAVYRIEGESTSGRQAVETLETAGFTASYVGRERRTSSPEVVYRKAAYEASAREVARLLGILTVRKDTTEENLYWLPEVRAVIQGG